jgi:hypothetical protein
MITKITNHETQAKELLLYQWQNSDNIKSLLDVYGKQANSLEDVFFQILDSLDLDIAQGISLDLIGKEVGEDRQSRSDEDYREAIKTRLFLNVTSGTPEDVIRTVKQITGATRVNYYEQYPAQIVLEIFDVEYLSKTPIIKRVTPAGVDLLFRKDIEIETATTYFTAGYSIERRFETNPLIDRADVFATSGYVINKVFVVTSYPDEPLYFEAGRSAASEALVEF